MSKMLIILILATFAAHADPYSSPYLDPTYQHFRKEEAAELRRERLHKNWQRQLDADYYHRQEQSNADRRHNEMMDERYQYR